MYPDMPDMYAANCSGIDTEFFYPSNDAGYAKETEFAKRVCAHCKIQDKCLEYALYHEEHGIWGGTSPKERKAIRRRRRIELKVS